MSPDGKIIFRHISNQPWGFRNKKILHKFKKNIIEIRIRMYALRTMSSKMTLADSPNFLVYFLSTVLRIFLLFYVLQNVLQQVILTKLFKQSTFLMATFDSIENSSICEPMQPDCFHLKNKMLFFFVKLRFVNKKKLKV